MEWWRDVQAKDRIDPHDIDTSISLVRIMNTPRVLGEGRRRTCRAQGRDLGVGRKVSKGCMIVVTVVIYMIGSCASPAQSCMEDEAFGVRLSRFG